MCHKINYYGMINIIPKSAQCVISCELNSQINIKYRTGD